MMPVYSQPCQMRPQGCSCQGFVNNSQHMSMDAPPSCHGSYVHGNFPAYNAYWPPCYPPQVPHHQCCMKHSGFHPPHGAYAPPCYIHPSFPVGYQPCYGSEKDVPGKPVGYYCGNCYPQICNPKNGRGVVIEEHGPEIEKGDQGEAVLPVRSTNCPYPITWIPYEKASNQEHGRSLGSGNHNQPPAEVEAPENLTIQKKFPKSWNGCFPFDGRAMKSLVQNQDMNKMPNGKTIELPFDISKLKPLLQGQDGKEGQNQKNREKPGRLPHPIFRIPSYGKWEDVESSESKESGNEGRNLESYPSDQHGNEGRTTQKQGKEGNFDSFVLSDSKEKSSVRNIPVQNHLQEPRNIPVKLLENHLPKPTEPTESIAKNEPVKNTEKEQSLSLSKASRLPPVCLRVDPLPKKRNGGSKSLSRSKRKEESITSEETKNVSSPRSKKAESKTVPEACILKCEEESKEMKMSDGSLHAIGTEQESVENNPKLQDRSNCEIVKPCEPKESREQPAKKTFIEDEEEDDAARMIQTRYRGYDVRRWEPIKKLKEIATIRKQMGDVKNRIQALVVSPDQHIEEKEIVVLGEMVMNLLLKVDAVQGLHPSIRDYRKSLARELSSIQEKLDSMKNSSAIAKKEAVSEQSIICSQPYDSPVNLGHSQVAEENEMVSDSNTEKVLVLSTVEHPMSVLNRTDEQPDAEAEEESGLFETLATATSSATIPEKMEENETVVPVNQWSADGNGTTVTKIEHNEAVVESLEEPVNELPQVVDSTQDPGNATVVSETEASASEKEDRKEDNDTVLPSEKDVEFSELPDGVNDDETFSQDLSSYTHEAQVIKIQETLDSVKNSSAIAEKEDVNEQLIISSQPCDSPVNLEHSQVAEEKKVVSDSNTEKVLVLPPDEHPMSILDRTDEQPDAEAEEGSGLFETLATAASSTTIPVKTVEGETIIPFNPLSADGNGTIVTKIEENKAVEESLEEPVNELPQVVEEILETSSTQDPDNASRVSEVEANASEKEDKMEDNDTVLPSERDEEFSELPAGVNDDDTCSQDSSSYTHEAQVTAMEPETASQEETDGNHFPDSSKGTSEPQDEKEQSPETEVIVSEQPPETEATKHEISEETKRLMEENQLFRETMESLVKAGREQLEAISKLTGRIKILEKKLSRKKRTQTRRRATKPMSAIDAVL